MEDAAVINPVGIGSDVGYKLILDTCTEVFGDDDANYKTQQLQKSNNIARPANLKFLAKTLDFF